MKANLKGLSGIKGLILLHGEKLVILAVGICTLLFIYYSMQLERLDAKYQADELKNQINVTDAAVRDFSWDKAIAENPEEVRVAKTLEKIAAPEVNPKDYPWGGVDVPVIKATVLRADPAIRPAVDVLATGGSGMLPFIDEQVMKERALKRQAAEAEKAKEEAERQEKEQQEMQEGGERGPRGPRGGRDEEGMNLEFDPEHPNRRPLETMARAPGAQVMGDERIERAFWAIVVAKVPIKEQLKLFRDAFENTGGGFDPQYDFPKYAGYVVERSEVVSGKELEWVRVGIFDGQGNKLAPFMARSYMFGPKGLMEVATTKWAAQTPEPVDGRYLDPDGLLAFPLPPLLGRDWGAEVTHPDIPLAINAPPPEMEVEPAVETPTATPATEEDGFSSPLDPTMSNFRRPGGEGGGMLGRGGYRGDSGEERYSRPGMMRGRGMFGDGERGGYSRGGGEGGAVTGTLPRGVDSWLLRFIDFSVEPGKKYKYRITLALDDPNNYYVNNITLQPKTLESAVLTRLKEAAKGRADKKPPGHRLTQPSEPSPTVGIPLAGSVRLAATKTASDKVFNDEPTVSLLVESFDLDAEGNAIHAANEKDLRRGYVANMVEPTEYVVPDGTAIDKKDSFKFMTGIMVVDVAGGEKLSRDITAPSRVLLLDPSGELNIRNELDDAEAVKTHKAIFTKPDKRKNRDGEAPGRGEGGFRFGRGG